MPDKAETQPVVTTPMDDAIELAHILNQSMDLTLTRSRPSIRKAGNMLCDMADISEAHRVWVPVFNGRFRAHTMPEPYEDLFNRACEVSGYSRQIKRGDYYVKDAARRANSDLQDKLHESIGSLIGFQVVEAPVAEAL